MKVKLLQRYAGPDGNYPPGAEIEVSDVRGADLCKRRFATPVKCAGHTETASVKPPETTTMGGEAVDASKNPKRGPGRPRKNPET